MRDFAPRASLGSSHPQLELCLQSPWTGLLLLAFANILDLNSALLALLKSQLHGPAVVQTHLEQTARLDLWRPAVLLAPEASLALPAIF